MSTFVRELEHADIGQLVALARAMQEESPIYQRFEFEPAMVERLKREHEENRANHSHILWSLLVFQDWRERWSV